MLRQYIAMTVGALCLIVAAAVSAEEGATPPVDPANPVAMFNLAEINLGRGDITRARFYAQRLTGSFEPSAEVLWLALRIERKAGDRAAEESLAAQLRRRFPASPEVSRLTAGRYDD